MGQRSTASPPEPASVFISASDQGAQLAARLRDDLRRSGFPVWFDLVDAAPGTIGVRRALDGLRTADTFIAVFAADSAACRRQSTEVALALARQRRIHRFIALTASAHASVPFAMRTFVVADVSTAIAYQRGVSRVRHALRTPAREVARRQLQQLLQLELDWASVHRVRRHQARAYANAAESLAFVFAHLMAGAISVGLSVLVALEVSQQTLGGRLASGMAIVVASLASVAIGFFHGMRTGRGALAASSARPDVVQEAGR